MICIERLKLGRRKFLLSALGVTAVCQPTAIASSLPAKNLIPPSLPHPKFSFNEEVYVPFKTEEADWRMDRGVVIGITYTPDECRHEGAGWYYLLRWTHIPGYPKDTGRESDYCHEDSLLAFEGGEAT